MVGPGNVISGNLIGVFIEGQSSSGNLAVPAGGNVVAANFIGINANNQAIPNYEYGVLISNSASNTVGGATTSRGNLIAANGIDGVEIFGGTPQSVASSSKTSASPDRNYVINNQVGMNISAHLSESMVDMDNELYNGASQVGQPIATPDGPIITFGSELYGVVVIGSSSNIIGAKGKGNTIDGNVEIGVYITRRDFPGNFYSVPTNNTLNSNTIENNKIYGVLRYEAPQNSVAERPQRFANTFSRNPIALADYLKGINGNTSLSAPRSKFHRKGHAKTVHVARARRSKAEVGVHHKMATVTRPRIPALFHPGAKTKVVAHVSSRQHH